jgi:MFS family permease
VVGSGVYWLLGKYSPRVQLTVFMALLGIGLGMIGFAHDANGMIAGMVVQQTGVGMAIPTLIGWAQRYLPFEHRGRGMGVWTACFFFGQFISPILIGLVRLSTGTMQGAFVIAGAFGLAAALIINFALAYRRPPTTI